MDRKLSLTVIPHPGLLRVTPSLSEPLPPNPVAILVGVAVLINANDAASSMSEITFSALDEEESTPSNPVYSTHYDLTTSHLSLGVKSFIQFKQTYNIDGLLQSFYSDPILVTLLNVPVAPLLTLNSNIRAEDQHYAVKINHTHNLNSQADGFSPITKIIAYTSKVGGTAPSDFKRHEIQVDILNGEHDYSKWYPVAFNLLSNETQYEVSVKLENALGESTLGNTVIVTPKNTPDQIQNIDAKALLSFYREKNILSPSSFVENDPRGDHVIRWSRSPDFIQLIQNGVGITKYHIYKQLMVKNQQSLYVASGLPSITSLDVPYTEPGPTVNSIQNQPVINHPIYAQVDEDYDYRHIIEGSVADQGKVYQYWVVAENVNGMGPPSAQSSNVFAFANPNLQDFNLEHSKTTTSNTGASITLYNGDMSMSFDAPSSINGAEDVTENRTIPASSTLSVGGVSNLSAPAVTLIDYKMKLQISKSSTPLVHEFNGEVTFKRQYSIVAGPTAGTALYSPLNKWVFSFDDAEKTAGQTLNQYFALNFGTKFVFSLIRMSTDPSELIDYIFEAGKSVVQRTAFKSPEKVSSIQLYSFNDNLTPVVTPEGNPALRMVFKQLTNNQMNGLANFTGLKQYFPHKDSYPIANASINHIQGNTNEIEYIIDMAAEGFGVNGNAYLRFKAFNDELGEFVDALESSPVIVAVAQTYPNSVTALNVVNSVDGGDLIINWTKQSSQSVIARGGFETNQIRNRVVVIRDSDTIQAPVYNDHTMWSAASQSVTVNGLTLGQTYKVYVIAEGIYTRPNIETGNRFDDAVISNNVAKFIITITGTPSAPVIDGRFPSDKRFTVLFDAPSDLKGIPANALEYMFFMNQESTAIFPYRSTGVLQEAVATSTLTSFATITKTFQTNAVSNNTGSLIDMINETPHYFAMMAKATIGGQTILRGLDTLTYNTTVVNGVNVNKILSLVSDLTVPIRTVLSEITSKETVYPGDGLPTPAGLELTGAQSKITVSMIKAGAPVTDVTIVADNNDSLNASSLPILPFTTKDVVYNSFSGIFALEQAFASSALNGPLAPYGPNGWNFRVVVNGGVTRYLIDFTNLTNGVVIDFNVRNAKKIGSDLVYSAAASASAAAEAPPAVVRNAFFSVIAGAINVSWLGPSNGGGAGVSGNSELNYKIQLLNSLGNVLVTNITALNVLTTQFTGLTNWTQGNNITYSVRILAFYNKFNGQLVEGDFVTPGPLNNILRITQLTAIETPIQIRVNTPPVNATGLFTAGDNKIIGSITTASAIIQTLYKLSSYKIFIKSTVGTPVAENEKQDLPDTTSSIGAGSGLGFNGAVTKTINDITSLANGKPYVVIIRAVPSYIYAQGPDDVEFTVQPQGLLTITNAVVVTGTAGKNMLVTYDSNGTGPLTSIIGLAKSSNSNTIVVKNLSSSLSNMPLVTLSGIESGNRAANQLGSFVLPFPELPSGLQDLLIVAGNANSVDTFVHPNTGSFFD